MRSVPRSFPVGAYRGARRVAPLEAFSRTEKIIAFCRVLLAVAAFAAVVLDPKQPFRPDVAYPVLLAYTAYSALLFLLVRGEYLRQEGVGPVSAAADIAWVTLISLFTEAGSGTSPFFLLHVFVISSVSVRWGLGATLAVTVALAALYPASLFVAGHWIGADLAFRRAHLFRPAYLLVLGYLIGYLGEHEHRSKRKLGFMLDLAATFRRDRPPIPALARLMRRTLHHFAAERGLLVVRDPESGRWVTWSATQRNGRFQLGLRLTDANPLPLTFATASEAFVANDLRPANATALCYDVLTGAMTRRPMTPRPALPAPDTAQAVIAAPVLVQLELRGYALVIREVRRKFTRADLEFLVLLVGQAAAGFENVRLQETAEELAVLEERARIARDLHDGFIQSLAGIDLRIEACKLLLQRDPARVPRELDELHQAVDRGYREVRQYLAVLREARGRVDDLWYSLDHLATEFASREHLRVHVARPASDPRLSPSTGYELTQIVREALHNASRHGHATQAVVKIAARPSHVYLVVRDNGSGFGNGHASVDADGFLAATAAPWSIRERTVAIGGSLSVWTKPGRGAEISITIPVGSRPGRHGSERRMQA
jgi:signal transduction histidine kinase